MSQQATPAAPSPSSVNEAASSDRRDGDQPTKILVVEDEDLVGRSIQRILERQGFEVDLAYSCAEAMSAFQHGRFHAVVSDIHLPGMSGIEFLREVREMDPETPVILITGKPSVDTAIEATELGAFHYLTKPFRNEELRSSVAVAVGHGRLARARSEAMRVSEAHITDRPESELSAQIDRAIETLWMAFQPIVDGARTIIGYEALLRCEQPGLREPLEFLDAAGRAGRGGELLAKVRASALEVIASVPDVSLFINIHPSQFLYDLLLADDAFAAAADRIVLELSEQHRLAGDPTVDHTVIELKSRGFRLAIDDLGAGYSGLATSVLISPDFVKLDGTLIRDADTFSRKREVITEICGAAHELGIDVIAEAVEKQSEFQVLRDLGCDFFQGFFVGQPGSLE